MQTTIPSKPSLWQALKDLDFLSAFFSWFFMLLTRLSEPLMLLATLYVVAETGVPVIAQPALHNLSVGIMITAPEIILPGAFVVASRAKEHSRWLYAVCWTFIVLTFITLISLFVWHFTGEALAYLMCARCATAVGYSILMRVMNHSKKVDHLQTVPVPNVQTLVQEIRQHFEHLQRENIEQVQHICVNTERRISEHMQRTVTEFSATSQAQKPILSEQVLFSGQPAIHSQIAPVFESDIVWELVEYGAACTPDEEPLEAEEESETMSTFTPQFVQPLTQLSPAKEVTKGPYVMTFEEAAEYTGLSIRTLKGKVNSGEIEKSISGKLKVKSLEKLRRKYA